MTVELAEFIRVYGPWAGLAAMVLWSLRAQIWSLIDRRSRLGEADRQGER